MAPGVGYSTMYSFGDSLSDVGNDYALSLNLAPISPPYDGGRFSNGPLGGGFWPSRSACRRPAPASPAATILPTAVP